MYSTAAASDRTTTHPNQMATVIYPSVRPSIRRLRRMLTPIMASRCYALEVNDPLPVGRRGPSHGLTPSRDAMMPALTRARSSSCTSWSKQSHGRLD